MLIVRKYPECRQEVIRLYSRFYYQILSPLYFCNQTCLTNIEINLLVLELSVKCVLPLKLPCESLTLQFVSVIEVNFLGKHTVPPGDATENKLKFV